MLDFLTTRRLFLQRSLALLAAAPTVPAFLDQTVMALDDPLDAPLVQKPTGKDGKILVVIQLSGGNDGLNTVIPFTDDNYHKSRPTLGVDPATVLKLNDSIGLHPSLSPLKKLYDQGQLGIVQGVGYPNPNRSHFRSMDIWQSARPDQEVETTGWIGRYFDNTCMGCDPRVGISIGQTVPLAMQGARILPLAFERPDMFRYTGSDRQGFDQLNGSGASTGLRTGPTTQPAPRAQPAQPPVTPKGQIDFLNRTAMDAQFSSDQILKIVKANPGASDYPTNEFGQGLATIAAMIAGGMPTRVYYVSLGSFDTHAGEQGRHAQLLQQLAQGLTAFWKDMTTQGNEQRVMMMTFSEFGRRVAQNASGGTDHGTAAPMFLIGPSALKPGILGAHPSLTDLDHGDLKYHTDFRSVYATILQNWLETPSKPILGQQFPLLPILAG